MASACGSALTACRIALAGGTVLCTVGITTLAVSLVRLTAWASGVKGTTTRHHCATAGTASTATAAPVAAPTCVNPVGVRAVKIITI